jgi:hypothetical protein
MAKVECFTPDGKMEMKEPVDAREAVESCGYTMELIDTSRDVSIKIEEEIIKVVEEKVVEETPIANKRGPKPKRNR